jgi:hypothetical protein
MAAMSRSSPSPAPARRPPAPARGLPERVWRAREGVEANARLTGSTAAILLALLGTEGVTLLRIGPLLAVHVFVGMMLVPPVLLKLGSTMYRFARYYSGAPAYREKGPPMWLLRLLGPFVVVLTLVLLASGIALLFSSGTWRGPLLSLHKLSFVLWFGAMTLHVLGHLRETARLAPLDWYGRSRRQIAGAGLRQWILAAALALGFLLGALVIGQAANFFSLRG